MNYTPKEVALDEAILKQARWIPWFLEGDKKKPAVEWSDYQNRKPFEAVKGNVGIVFDKQVDCLVGLDLDDCIDDEGNYNAQATRAIELFQGKAYIERSVSGHGLHFIFYADLGISFNAKPIEYYEQGRYFTFSGLVVPGSSSTPQPCQKEIKQFIQEYAPQKLNPKVKEAASDIGLVSSAQVREALAKISPDCNRGDWFTAACALHYEFEGEEKGFELFHEWSARADAKYQGEEDCRKVWDSLGNYKGAAITIGSLFELAKSAEFSPVYEYALSQDDSPDIEVHGKEKEKKRWLTTRDLDSKLGPIEWLIDDYFEASTISIIWGDTMAFKSFLALEVCFCVAAGIQWHGKEVRQGTVLYVCGEGANGIARRITGLRQKYNIWEEIPLYVSHGSRDMIEWEAMKEVIAYGQSLQTKINLVMVDTVNRNFSGEENSSKDVAKAYKHLDKVKETFDCSIAMVHHTGKSGTTIRGSAAWVQNVDASYEMQRQSKSFYTTFIPHKMKDAALGDEMNFEMKEVFLKRKGDKKETLLTTLISEHIDEIPVERTRRKEGGVTVTILKCLEEKGVAVRLKEIEDYASDNGQGIDSIKTTLLRMVKSGEVLRVKPGVYELPPLTK
ncbi:Primase, C-terminal 2 [uncultured Caudovirales phage]|uniref:Primase, C-terminal 2 n=1 Tax=uncultured Caudovirales phage TaxID=2100421 RepID=A0A6J7W4W4_9CAUD|nr:Primase, C-terminal 2 [uncultured Caudovirales phage]